MKNVFTRVYHWSGCWRMAEQRKSNAVVGAYNKCYSIEPSSGNNEEKISQTRRL